VTVPTFGPEHRRLLLRDPDQQHPLPGIELGQVPVHHLVLALPFDEADHRQLLGGREPQHLVPERPGHRRHQRTGGKRRPLMGAEELATPPACINRGWYRFRNSRSIDSTSKLTRSVSTSATLRVTVIVSSGRRLEPNRLTPPPRADMTGTIGPALPAAGAYDRHPSQRHTTRRSEAKPR